jgi:hypothetical protein
MRRKWSQWQRILLRRISASPTGGDDDPVIVIVAGKRRMFAGKHACPRAQLSSCNIHTLPLACLE